jgi:3-oxoacyl-[acyl-carrier protein] reductase
MKQLEGKVIIVTGASRGIGKEIALLLASHGAKITVNFSSNQQEAESVVRTIIDAGGEAIAVQADISKRTEFTKLFDETIARFGKPDVLVNNAGIMITKMLKDQTEEDFVRQFDINVKGTFFGLQEASAKLSDNGCIINFSSSTTRMMLPAYAVYSATKSAVEQMTRVFAREIGRGISVNAIAPGPTNTELFTHGKSEEMITRLAGMNAFNRLGEPEDIAKVVLFMAGDESRWITGQVIPVNGGMA